MFFYWRSFFISQKRVVSTLNESISGRRSNQGGDIESAQNMVHESAT